MANVPAPTAAKLFHVEKHEYRDKGRFWLSFPNILKRTSGNLVIGVSMHKHSCTISSMVLRNAAFRAELLTPGVFLGRVQVSIKFIYIGIGAAVASYLREFSY